MRTLKQICIAALLILFIAPVFAQTKTAPPAGDCYGEWYTLFRERGAKTIPDGTQEIVISIRKDGYAQCFMGKVDVENGKMKMPVFIAKEDGSYQPLSETGLQLDPASLAGKTPDALTSITDGMSVTAYTTDHETVKLFFFKFVNDKPKKNKVAPRAATLVKN
jgi:hypothetical protein